MSRIENAYALHVAEGIAVYPNGIDVQPFEKVNALDNCA